MTEVCCHYGDSILEIMNEQFGDGIMSSIDFKLTVSKRKGDKGEDRVVLTWDGKFLAHIEQTKWQVRDFPLLEDLERGASGGFLRKREGESTGIVEASQWGFIKFSNEKEAHEYHHRGGPRVRISPVFELSAMKF